MQDWDIPIDGLTTREELVARFGGSVFSGGIVPSNTSPNIFIFTDPSAGSPFGYLFDGPSEDGQAFYYTGAGATGDQRLDGANGSVLSHLASGRSLRLFEAVGNVPGKQTRIQKYLGEYSVDLSAPYRLEGAIGKGGTRLVVVFRLVPVDGRLTNSGYVGPKPIEPSTSPSARRVPPEIDSTLFFETGAGQAGLAVRSESALVRRFMTWRGGIMDRWAIRVPSENIVLLTDIYDPADRVLYEAKSSASRAHVRQALGQLLDYRRHIEVPDLRTRLLVPERPGPDLIDMVRRNEVGIAYATDGPEFAIED